MQPVLEEKCQSLNELGVWENTYVNTNEPTAAVSSANSLAGFTVLVKMHIKVILHLLLPVGIPWESDTALLTLARQVLVQELRDRGPLPANWDQYTATSDNRRKLT